MARPKVNLNSAGIGLILKSPAVQHLIRVKADQVATKVRGMGIDVEHDSRPLPVTVDSKVTDRAKSTVMIAHPSGEAVQAKHGALTKAAAQSGLDVGGGE